MFRSFVEKSLLCSETNRSDIMAGQDEDQRKKEEIAKLEERIRAKEQQEKELLEKIRRELEKR